MPFDPGYVCKNHFDLFRQSGLCLRFLGCKQITNNSTRYRGHCCENSFENLLSSVGRMLAGRIHKIQHGREYYQQEDASQCRCCKPYLTFLKVCGISSIYNNPAGDCNDYNHEE